VSALLNFFGISANRRALALFRRRLAHSRRQLLKIHRPLGGKGKRAEQQK